MMSKTPLCDEAEFEVHSSEIVPLNTYSQDSCERVVSSKFARELERDAARYRKLRAMRWADSMFCVVDARQGNLPLVLDCLSHERLDNFLDAMES